MGYYLTKVLPLLVMPVSIVLAGLLLALLLVFFDKRRPAVICLLLTTLLLWGSASPFAAEWMLWSLQRQYPPAKITDVPASDCIVVLGGAVSPPLFPRTDIELTDATDRVYQAARLYREGKGTVVIVAAGNQPWLKNIEPEAMLIKRLLLEWGVPEPSVLLENTSRRTYENAVNVKPLIAEAGCAAPILVTSSWHMPRAKASFEKAGIEVFPFSVDVRFTGDIPGSLPAFIPTGDALAATSLAIREWMGIWVYRWRGWSD